MLHNLDIGKMNRAFMATRQAYADNQFDPPSASDYERRNLDWRWDEWLSLEEATPSILAIGWYNFFKPEEILATLKELTPKVLIQPAREGSVALYFCCNEDEANLLRNQCVEDEFHYNDGTLRLWWD